MADKIIHGKKDIGLEIDAIKKVLIKKNILSEKEINDEKGKK